MVAEISDPDPSPDPFPAPVYADPKSILCIEDKNLFCYRNERLPFVPPENYWKDTPTKREQVFRHVPLAHLGAEGQLSEKVIVRAHDLQVLVH